MKRSPLPPKKPRPEPTNETESLYGPKRLWKRLGEIAYENDLSKSELAVWILEQWLKDFEKGKQH